MGVLELKAKITWKTSMGGNRGFLTILPPAAEALTPPAPCYAFSVPCHKMERGGGDISGCSKRWKVRRLHSTDGNPEWAKATTNYAMQTKRNLLITFVDEDLNTRKSVT